MILGAQFYTIRDFCKTTDALADSLSRVAEIGYTTVQISGTCAYDPAWLAEELRKNGLSCVITHTDPLRIAKEPDTVVSDHNSFGCDYIGIGYYELGGDEKVQEFISTYQKAMRVFRENGKKLMYHNHDMEFTNKDGRCMLEKLAAATDPAELGFTLDTYWVQSGGGDAAWWLRQLSGRVDCVHYKDMSYPRKMRAVGEGNMNFDEIIRASADAGVKYALVEQDDCDGENPFSCLQRSYEYLKSFGLQ